MQRRCNSWLDFPFDGTVNKLMPLTPRTHLINKQLTQEWLVYLLSSHVLFV